MNSKGSKILTASSIGLILLVLIGAGWSLATNLGWVNAGFGGNPIAGGRMGSGLPRGSFEDGSFQPPENFQGRTGNFSRTDGLTGVFGVVRWLGMGLNLAGLLIGAVAVIGIHKRKKWGVVLAIVLAALIGLTSLFGLFRFAVTLSYAQSLIKVALAVAVVVLLLLPSARKAFNPAPALVDDDEDDEDDQ